MRLDKVYVAFGALGLLVAACGDDTSGAGGGDAASSGTGGAATVVTTGTGPQNSCVSDARTPTTLVIKNESSSRIWFLAEDLGPSALSAITIEGQSSPRCPCDELEGCSIDPTTANTNYGYLDPGDAFDQRWVGLLYDEAPSAVGCVAEQSCAVGRRPSNGDLVAVATAFRGEPACAEPCECDITKGGLCNLEGADAPTDPVEATVTFAFPSAQAVEIVFTD